MRSGTMSAEKILIDTSVWIDYFQNKSSPISEEMDRILSEDEVYVPKIVIAELIQGGKSSKEIAVIKDFLEAFHIIDQKEDTWIKAGRLSYDLKKRGKTIHLLDCYIAIIAQEFDCKIFTLNRHFRDIQKALPVLLIE
jgi:predicted nucleic acid-binding protein